MQPPVSGAAGFSSPRFITTCVGPLSYEMFAGVLGPGCARCRGVLTAKRAGQALARWDRGPRQLARSSLYKARIYLFRVS